MPLQVIIHDPECNWKQTCSCQPTVLNNPKFRESAEASEAHGGNSNRMEIKVVPPPHRGPDPVPAHRSQARRHTREISN